MTDVRTQVLRSWYGTPIVSHFMPSDEARAQRVVDMIAAEYVKRTPLSASGTSEMPPASVVPAEQPQRASTEDAGSAGGALPPWIDILVPEGTKINEHVTALADTYVCASEHARAALRARDERIASLEAENARLRERAEKAEYSARQFCGAHIGVPQPDCPVCGKPNIAAARRDEQGTEVALGAESRHGSQASAPSPSPAAGSARAERIIKAATNMDWAQVALHRSSPCFHLEDDGRFCGRAYGWAGHSADKDHLYEPLYVAITRAVKAAHEAAAPVAVTRERIKKALFDAADARFRAGPSAAAGTTHEDALADAVLSALSAPVSAEALERACKQAYLSRPFARSWEHDADRMARIGEARALLKQLGIATEGA